MRNDNNKNMPNQEAREASKVLLLHSGDDSNSVSKLKTIIENADYKSENIYTYDVNNSNDNNGLAFVKYKDGSAVAKTDDELEAVLGPDGAKKKFHEMNKIVLFMPQPLVSSNLSNNMSIYLNHWLEADENNGLVTLASYKHTLGDVQAPSNITLGEATFSLTGDQFTIGENKNFNPATAEGTVVPKEFVLSNSSGKKADFLEGITDAKIDTAIRDGDGNQTYHSGQQNAGATDLNKVSYDYATSVNAGDSTVHIEDSNNEPFLISRKIPSKEIDQFVFVNMDADLIANSGNSTAETIFTRAIDYVGHLDGCTQDDAANYEANHYHDALPQDGTCRYNEVTNIVMPDEGYTNYKFCVTANIDVFDENRPSKITVDDLIDNTLTPHGKGYVTLKKTDDTNSHLYGEDNKGYIHDADGDIVGSWEFSDTEKTKIVNAKLAVDSSDLDDYISYVSDTSDSNYNADTIGEHGARPVTYNLVLHYSNDEDSAKWDTNTEDDNSIYVLLDLMKDIKDGFALGSDQMDDNTLATEELSWDLLDDRKMPGGVENAKAEFTTDHPNPDIGDPLSIHSKQIDLLTDKENVKLVSDKLEVKFCFDSNTRVNVDLIPANTKIDDSDFKLSLLDSSEARPIKDSSATATLNIAYAGCDDTEASNYNSLTDFPISSECKFTFCTNSNADNYNEFTHNSLTFDDLESEQIIGDDSLCTVNGCTDSNACNYYQNLNPDNEFKVIEDGSCVNGLLDIDIDVFRNVGPNDNKNANAWNLPESIRSQMVNDLNLSNSSFSTEYSSYVIFSNIDTQGFKIEINGKADCYENIKLQIMGKKSTSEIPLNKDSSELISYDSVHKLSDGEYNLALVGDLKAIAGNAKNVDLGGIKLNVIKLQNGDGCEMTSINNAPSWWGNYSSNTYSTFAYDETTANNNNALSIKLLESAYSEGFDFNNWYPEIKTLFEKYVNGSPVVCKGCTDSTKFGYDASADEDDGSCKPFKTGCMNDKAINYDENANIAGTCILPEEVVYGCMTPSACNYDSNANIDDGSCIDYSVSINLKNVLANDTANDIVKDEVFWSERNPAIQEKDTNNKIHNLKFRIDDEESYVHIHLFQQDIINKKFGLGDRKLRFLNNNKKLQLDNVNGDWQDEGTYDFHTIVKYAKIFGGSVEPFNIELNINGVNHFGLIKSLESDVTLHNLNNGNKLTLTMPAGNARISSTTSEIESCHIDYLRVTNSDDVAINLQVIDAFDGEPILTKEIYSSGTDFVIPSESLNDSAPNDGTQNIETHRYELRTGSANILLDELNIASYYSGCIFNEAVVTDTNHPLYGLNDAILNEDTNVTYSLLSHKGSMHPYIAEYAREFSCRLDLCNVPQISYADLYGETITIKADNEDDKCEGGSGSEVDYICTPQDGTCEYTGCTNSYSKTYNADITTHDESKCMYVVCGDTNADNYQEDFSWVSTGMNKFVDNSLCKYKGCIDARAFNYNSKATLDEEWNDQSRVCEFKDCYDSTACNYASNYDDLRNYYGHDALQATASGNANGPANVIDPDQAVDEVFVHDDYFKSTLVPNFFAFLKQFAGKTVTIKDGGKITTNNDDGSTTITETDLTITLTDDLGPDSQTVEEKITAINNSALLRSGTWWNSTLFVESDSDYYQDFMENNYRRIEES